MATRDLIMMDEESFEDEKTVAIVLSDNCVMTGNIVSIPLNEAMSIIANIAVQVALTL